MRNIYKSVTEEIVNQLEQGVTPWVQPWDSPFDIPRNAVTNRPYNGINVLVLWAKVQKKGYRSSRWLTFKQAKDAGLTVKKGEKGTRVVFVKQFNKDETSDDESESIKEKNVVCIMRSFVVFNLDQLGGDQDKLDALYPVQRVIDPNMDDDMFAEANTFVQQCNATIVAGSKACYNSSSDKIVMPLMEDFFLTGQCVAQAQSAYYATLFHELVHWSGVESRLNRDMGNRFGDASYAMEELVAELGSAFLCAEFGIAGKLQHASYIQSWLKVLKQDEHAIFTAASKAQQAVDFLLSREVNLKIAVTG